MDLQLFHRWQCPYSAQVRDFIDANGLRDRIDYIEITEVDGAQDQLADLTGKSQVPCLVIDGRPLLESADIVQWLRQNMVES
ncbi:glutaredoxin family protein [Microvirga roseola]|uniref:glutaredoxin family protein n=1 Tax=Microvirga roseola TaxID=2883126 RepID=UPI001E53FB38|nr:glutaredoxin [Microvirga roseola]